MIEQKKISPLPQKVYVLTVMALTLSGLFVSIYLSYSHYMVYTDIGYKSFCAITKSINCDTVSQSRYSIFMDVPVPLWGVFGYGFIVFLVLVFYLQTRDKGRLWSLLILVSFIYSAYSTILAFISAYAIKSYCIMCMITYGINLFVLFFSWLTRRRFCKKSLFTDCLDDIAFLMGQKRVFVSFISLFSIVIAAAFLMPRYWEIELKSETSHAHRGITEEGHPWIGSDDPELTITEFSDYQCFQCKKMHYYLRRIVSEPESRIRLIHRNFPMDHEYNFIVKSPLHVGSGKLALLSLYAAEKEKFWEVNDALYALAGKTDQIDLKLLAGRFELNYIEMVNALNSQRIKNKLNYDLWEGMKKRITGTPSYVIDGNVYVGQIPPVILKKFMN